ncbi:MAG: aldehyde dehydrogenase family protein [Firmicutes bacterium]|nr:aldehyde dehydrogenase family protein [Bacillota bacterium]
MEKYRGLFINGQWKDASDGKKGKVINPATEEVIAEYAIATEEDVDLAVQAAQKAYDEVWSDTTPGERAAMLYKMANLIEENIDEFTRLEALNCGKPLSRAKGEHQYSIDCIRYYAGICRNPEGKSTQEYMRGITTSIRREPLGVTAGLCPWNYPLMMFVWKAFVSLAAGNTVVIKPASITPLTALYLAELAADVFPPGVLNVVTGSGSVVGEGLCKHPLVKMVSMTGSSETGRRIAELCSGTLKHAHLELGGKAPNVVFNDAIVDELVATMREHSFKNCGQDCGQACRFIVQSGVYDEVVQKMTEMAKAVKIGDPFAPDTEQGALITVAHMKEVQEYVERAVKEGAVIETGGKRIGDKGAFFEPTVITNVDQKSEIVQHEVFGPVVTIQKFETEEEGLAMANDCMYGLAASVWTMDAKRSLRMARKLHFGTVCVNTYSGAPAELPWGGFNQSGYGKDMSGYAFEEYTQIKCVDMAF